MKLTPDHTSFRIAASVTAANPFPTTPEMFDIAERVSKLVVSAAAAVRDGRKRRDDDFNFGDHKVQGPYGEIMTINFGATSLRSKAQAVPPDETNPQWQITFSTTYIMDQEEIREILIHEMIHIFDPKARGKLKERFDKTYPSSRFVDDAFKQKYYNHPLEMTAFQGQMVSMFRSFRVQGKSEEESMNWVKERKPESSQEKHWAKDPEAWKAYKTRLYKMVKSAYA